MDIRVVLTRAGIFIAVYTAVLGLPIWLGVVTDRWFWALGTMAILSTIGPFIYSYLREQAENILYREQKRYQSALQALAHTMPHLRDLHKILETASASVYETVMPDFVGVYLFSKKTNSFELRYNYSNEVHPLENNIPEDSSFITRFKKHKKSAFADSLNFPTFINETAVVPYFASGDLYGFLLLGPKPKKGVYTESDLAIFDILSSQISLAVENCVFWQDEKTRLAREEQIRRQQAMDRFSASLAHEIDNPLFAVVGTAEVIKLSVTEDLKDCIPQDKISYLQERIDRMVKDLFRISKMIKAIREFSAQNKGEFTTLKVDEVIEGFLNIVGPQLRYEGVHFGKTVEPHLLVHGNKIHLEEVLVNLVSNSIHAVKNNKADGKKVSLRVYKNTVATFTIEIQDTGYGIEHEMLEDIFLDFVTTKASSEGSGMGLARVRKIVENHDGKVWAQSKGKGTGATFFVELPLAK